MTSELNERSSFSKITLLHLFSKPEYYDLIIMIGDKVSNRDENLSHDCLRNKLNLTKKECNSRIGVLMNYDLVDMIDNQYNLTKLGIDTYESLRMIDNAIKLNQTFDTTNIFEFWKIKGLTN